MKLAKMVLPDGDKIVVLLDSGEKKTKSGLFIPPDNAGKQKPQEGTVIAVSPYLLSVWQAPMSDRPKNSGGFIPPEAKIEGVAIGDRVLFAQYAGDDIRIRDTEKGEDVTVKVIGVESLLGRIEDAVEEDAPPETK